MINISAPATAAAKSPTSAGKVLLWEKGSKTGGREFYVSIIGAEWIDRKDRT